MKNLDVIFAQERVSTTQIVALNDLADKVHYVAHVKGWHPTEGAGEDTVYSVPDDVFINTACNNFHNEASELHESWRNGKLHAPCDKAEKMRAMGLEPLTQLEEETADIIIRALDFSARMGIDIGTAVRVKHEFNMSREHRHGNKQG
jgi:NTP pyrophosphatase (non-canonical NTP hydrolase)